MKSVQIKAGGNQPTKRGPLGTHAASVLVVTTRRGVTE